MINSQLTACVPGPCVSIIRGEDGRDGPERGYRDPYLPETLCRWTHRRKE